MPQDDIGLLQQIRGSGPIYRGGNINNMSRKQYVYKLWPFNTDVSYKIRYACNAYNTMLIFPVFIGRIFV